MKRDNVNYLTVGALVLLALGILLYTLYRLTGGVGENDPYFVFYSNVGGLDAGTPVTYEGFKLGSVTGIEPIRSKGRTRYKVSLQVRDGWKIPDDSIARIYSEGLLAETVINIEEGSSNRYLKVGLELQGSQGVDVFAAVNSVASDVSWLLNETVRPLLDNLNGRISTLGSQVDSRLPVILDGLQKLVETLQISADRLPKMLSGENEEQINRVVENTQQVSVNLLQLSKGLLQTQAKADRLLSESQSTVTDNREDMRKAVLALRHSLEDVAIHTDGILQNLQGTSRNLNEFSRQIRQNPGLLISGKPPRDEGAASD